MASPKTFVWPATNTTLVAPLQTLAGAGFLTLNVNGAYPNSFDFQGLNRVVSLTSANNLGGVNFTITGTLNGLPVTETIAGPNANTVESTQLFSVVSSILTNGAAAAVSAGSGSTGRTAFFTYDPHCNVCAASVEVIVTNGTGAITYSFVVTLDDPTSAVFPPVYFSPIAAMTAATTNQFANFLYPVSYCAISVTASTGTAHLDAVVLQQGLRS